MSLRINKEGYYIIDSLEKLKEWHRMTDLKPTEKHKMRALLKAETEQLKKESLEKQKKQK
jgi:hypothetical protein